MKVSRFQFKYLVLFALAVLPMRSGLAACGTCSDKPEEMTMRFTGVAGTWDLQPQGIANVWIDAEEDKPVLRQTSVWWLESQPFKMKGLLKGFNLRVVVPPSSRDDDYWGEIRYGASYSLEIEMPCGMKKVTVGNAVVEFPKDNLGDWWGEPKYLFTPAPPFTVYAVGIQRLDSEGNVKRVVELRYDNSPWDLAAPSADFTYRISFEDDSEEGNKDPLEAGSDANVSTSQASNREVSATMGSSIPAPLTVDGDETGVLWWKPAEIGDSVSIEDSVSFISSTGTTGVQLVTSSTTANRKQVYVPGGGAMNVVSSGTQLSIALYDMSGVGSLGSDGLYAVSGTPKKEVRITQAAGVVTYEVEFDGLPSSDFTFEEPSSGAISRTNNANGRKDVIATSNDDDLHTVTEEIWDTNPSPDKLLKKTTTVSKDFPWGSEVITEIEDPDGEARTTTYAYIEDEESDGYRKLSWVKYPDGSWERYGYDSEGRTAWELRPFKDEGPTPDIASGDDSLAVIREYSGGRISSEYTMIHTIDNNFETYVYTTGTASGSGATLDITTQTSAPVGGPQTVRVTRKFASDYRLHSVDHENGTRDSYAYDKGLYVLSITHKFEEDFFRLAEETAVLCKNSWTLNLGWHPGKDHREGKKTAPRQR